MAARPSRSNGPPEVFASFAGEDIAACPIRSASHAAPIRAGLARFRTVELSCSVCDGNRDRDHRLHAGARRVTVEVERVKPGLIVREADRCVPRAARADRH
jgi:hypothetical protein